MERDTKLKVERSCCEGKKEEQKVRASCFPGFCNSGRCLFSHMGHVCHPHPLPIRAHHTLFFLSFVCPPKVYLLSHVHYTYEMLKNTGTR